MSNRICVVFKLGHVCQSFVADASVSRLGVRILTRLLSARNIFVITTIELFHKDVMLNRLHAKIDVDHLFLFA